MKFNKKLVVLAAAGALTALTALPAMALENEFHGTYTIKGILSDYNNGGGKDQSPVALRGNERANNFAEQRARIFYTAKANDDLKLVTGFELDTRFGGMTDGKYYGSSDAGGFDADGISLETKWVYLDFNATKNLNIKTGVMPYKDSIKGLFVDADMPMIYTKTKLDAFTLGLGYARYNEVDQANNTVNFSAGHLGDRATDLFLLDTSYALSKDVKFGFSYYLRANYLGTASNNLSPGTTTTASGTLGSGTTALSQSSYSTPDATKNPEVLHTLALNGEGKIGPVALSGFAAMQLGNAKNTIVDTTASKAGLGVTAAALGKNTNFHGYALNAAAKMAVGPGTAKTAILYASGDDGQDNQNNGWQFTGAQSYNESGLMLLVRNNATSGTTNGSEFVRRSISNVALYTIGYDAQITPKAYLNTNVGFGWAAKNYGAPADKALSTNRTNFMGSEIALEGGYKVFDNLTASVQAAYLVLGGYYKGAANDSAAAAVKDPADPYTARLVLSYLF